MDNRGRPTRPISASVLSWTARVIVAGCALASFVILLAAATALVQTRGLPPDEGLSRLRGPWVDDHRSQTVADAFATAPQAALSTRLVIQEKEAPPPGQTAFDTTVEISGPADNPVIAAVRRGRPDTETWTLVGGLAGVPAFSSKRYSPSFGTPTVHVAGSTATVVVAGSITLSPGDLDRIEVRQPDSCDLLKDRAIDVHLRSFTVVGVRRASGDLAGCGRATWPGQSDTDVSYTGLTSAVVGLQARTTGGSSRPLLAAAPPVAADALRTLGVGAAAALPVTVVWWRLRRRRPLRVSWPVAVAVGALLLFHVGVVVHQTLEGPYFMIYDRLTRSRPDVSLPFYGLTAAVIVALGFVWRRETRAALNAGPERRRPGSGFALILLTALFAAAMLGRPASTDGAGYGWGDWLRGWPGLVATGLVFAALSGFAEPVARRKFLPRSGREPANWSAAGAFGGAVVFALVELLGFWFAPSAPTEATQDIDTWFTDTIPNWLTWTTSLAGGLTLVAVVIVVATVPASLAAVSRHRDRWPRWRSRLVVGGALAMASAILFPASVAAGNMPYAMRVGWLADSPGWAALRNSSPGLVTIAAAAALGCAAAAAVLVGVLGGGRAVRVSAALGALLTIILSVLGPLSSWGGILGTVVAVTPPLLAGAAVWLAIGRLLRRVVEADPAGRESPLARGLRRLRGTGWLIALLLSVPLASYAGAGTTIGWYTFPMLAASIDGCVALLVAGILVIVAYGLGSPGTPGSVARGSYAALRAVAVLIAVVGLLTSSATVAGIPVAFLTGWALIELWLLPRRGAPEDVLVEVGADARRPAVDAVVDQARDAAESRAVAALERGLRKDLAAEAISPEDRAARVERVKALAVKRRSSTDPRRAFSTYAGEPPWARARTFGVVGLLAGLPWMVLDVGSLFATQTTFRVVDGVASALVLLRFAVAGFVVGLAYPMVRGNTGLTKGLTLFVTLAVPGLCATLLPDPHAAGVLPAALLQVAQWLSFGLVLGIVADLRQLRMAGLGWRGLGDVHNLTALTASFSTFVLAIATAAAAAIGTGAATVMLDSLLPQSPAAATAPGTASSSK